MKSSNSKMKAVALAVALAAGLSSSAYADDNSMSIWTGESYRYFNGGQNFPYGNPVFDKSPSKFRETNPHGLTNAQYAALSQEDPFFQPVTPRDPDADHVATLAAAQWRRDNPHGLSDREYQALSANSSVWQLPDASSPQAMAQADTGTSASAFRARLARFFHLSPPSAVN